MARRLVDDDLVQDVQTHGVQPLLPSPISLAIYRSCYVALLLGKGKWLLSSHLACNEYLMSNYKPNHHQYHGSR